MLDSISHFSQCFLPFLLEKTHSSLKKEQHQKIFVIAIAALALLATVYMMYYFYHRKSSNHQLDSIDPNSSVEAESSIEIDSQEDSSSAEDVVISEKWQKTLETHGIKDQADQKKHLPLFQAMEWMFEDRELEWDQWLTLTDEQKTERYEQLKNVISKISGEMINKQLNYRDGMIDREQTLLLQAMMKIQDPVRRLEIVKMLIEQGANPLVCGRYEDEVSPFQETRRIGDPELLELIELSVCHFQVDEIKKKYGGDSKKIASQLTNFLETIEREKFSKNVIANIKNQLG